MCFPENLEKENVCIFVKTSLLKCLKFSGKHTKPEFVENNIWRIIKIRIKYQKVTEKYKIANFRKTWKKCLCFC